MPFQYARRTPAPRCSVLTTALRRQTTHVRSACVYGRTSARSVKRVSFFLTLALSLSPFSLSPLSLPFFLAQPAPSYSSLVHFPTSSSSSKTLLLKYLLFCDDSTSKNPQKWNNYLDLLQFEKLVDAILIYKF